MELLDKIIHPPAGASADWTIPQRFEAYGEAEHRIWVTLYDRQARILPGRACDAFLHGLDALDLHGAGIPDFHRLNERLSALTGWRIVAVPGLVPDAIFFDHLAHRRFPAANFIRRADQLDYLQEPDVFHDVFGHVPLLTDPVFADYMQAYGEGGIRALGLGRLHNLARLYWYTVEFGLLQTSAGLRIYGAGIVSSRTESIFALESSSPHRIGCDLERVMRTPYRIDDFQQVYFVIPSLQGLLDLTIKTDFGPIYARLAEAPDIAIAAVAPNDKVLSRGTQAYARGLVDQCA
ncbi:phenylalanine 4-monooxygenase [Methylocapsa polymorpha]|uniref:Phenylalanine-4-hydroxylase n=1 Tax=Methylocapsa polymorpha TaxID=3080828 RepID=A0ABZ0HU07_9HYPH|nr:phenylalanine 4-monooxygenase [Methylocapsa sp. RX1]